MAAATLPIVVEPELSRLIDVLRCVAKHATACAEELASMQVTPDEDKDQIT